MLFCYTEHKQIPIDQSMVELINRAVFGSREVFQYDLVARLQEELKQNNNALYVTLNPEDVEEIIRICGPGGSDRDYSTSGCVVWHLFDCLEKNTVIDLRTISWEQAQTLGTIPVYKWKDKHDPNAVPWRTVRLRMGCRVIYWDGRENQLSWGDYIVQTPAGFGSVSHFAHETQCDVETVMVS